jgi:hypothetical protein
MQPTKLKDSKGYALKALQAGQTRPRQHQLLHVVQTPEELHRGHTYEYSFSILVQLSVQVELIDQVYLLSGILAPQMQNLPSF